MSQKQAVLAITTTLIAVLSITLAVLNFKCTRSSSPEPTLAPV